MKQVHDRLGAVEKERTASFAQLAEQITALGATTHTLSRALRTPSVRGPLGRDAAAPRRRARRHAAPLRLRRAAGPVVRRRSPAPRHGRPPAARQEHRGRRQGAARGVSRRAGGERRRGPHRTAAGARPPRPRAHGTAGQQGVLGGDRGRVARDGGDVPARRDALQRGAPARPLAHRIRPQAAGAARQPDHAHRPADDRGPYLAAGSPGRELQGGGAAGQGVLRTAGAVHRALRRRPQETRGRGAGLQPGGRVARIAACSSAPGGCASSTSRRAPSCRLPSRSRPYRASSLSSGWQVCPRRL